LALIDTYEPGSPTSSSTEEISSADLGFFPDYPLLSEAQNMILAMMEYVIDPNQVQNYSKSLPHSDNSDFDFSDPNLRHDNPSASSLIPPSSPSSSFLSWNVNKFGYGICGILFIIIMF